jgi:predicted ArsR family transcriptional regulator
VNEADLTALGVLAEPSRRALYDYVVAAADPVGREQAAAAVGLPVHSAKFHLDRLVEEGLLDVEFRRLTGRSGPGAGRPAKLYRRSARAVTVSLPERRYDLAGSVLAQAIELAAATGVPVPEAVASAAHDLGAQMAQEPPVPRSGKELQRVAQVLERGGYEPRLDDTETELILANCPFDRLAREHTDLVCSMNLALVEGTIDALSCAGVRAHLEPSPDYCCVRARTAS